MAGTLKGGQPASKGGGQCPLPPPSKWNPVLLMHVQVMALTTATNTTPSLSVVKQLGMSSPNSREPLHTPNVMYSAILSKKVDRFSSELCEICLTGILKTIVFCRQQDSSDTYLSLQWKVFYWSSWISDKYRIIEMYTRGTTPELKRKDC